MLYAVEIVLRVQRCCNAPFRFLLRILSSLGHILLITPYGPFTCACMYVYGYGHRYR